jgi:hypothetical protein
VTIPRIVRNAAKSVYRLSMTHGIRESSYAEYRGAVHHHEGERSYVTVWNDSNVWTVYIAASWING